MTTDTELLLPQAPQILLAELLFTSAPTLDPTQFAERLAHVLPQSKLVSKPTDARTLLIAHESHQIEYEGGKKAPPMSMISIGSPIDFDRIEAAAHQTWDWPEVRDIPDKVTHQIVLTEMMASKLDPQARVDLYFQMLHLLVELTKPIAVHCQHAERLLEANRVVEASVHPTLRLETFLNVRFFDLKDGEPGEQVMDTRGLAALNLPDIQIHYKKLNPEPLAAALFNVAMYIFEKGDVIKDGHTIQGLDASQKWKCKHEHSLIGPQRIVIDLNPGEPYVAGEREPRTK